MTKKKTSDKAKQDRNKKAKYELWNSLSDDQKKRVALMKEADEVSGSLKPDDPSYNILLKCDQAYQQWDEIMSNVEAQTLNILMSARRIERNKIDLAKGSTDQVSPTCGLKLDLRDLEIENMQHLNIINTGRRKLWLYVASLRRFADTLGLDGKVYFSYDTYMAKLNWVKSELKKNGVDLLKHRQ